MFKTIPATEPQQLTIDRVAIAVRKHLPEYAVLGSLCSIKFTEQVSTACTDGRTIWFGTKFFSQLNEKEFCFVWLHELLHVALRHHLRRGERNHKRYNIAADYVINLILQSVANRLPSVVKFPSGNNECLLDEKYRGLNESDVYDLLKDEEGQGEGQGIGGVIDGTFETPEQKQLEETRIAQTIQRASLASRLAGSGKGGAIGEIADADSVKIKSVRALLSTFVDNTLPTLGNWSSPNKRLQAAGIHYPTIHKHNLAKLCFAVDTSVSVDMPSVERMLGVVQDVFDSTAFDQIALVFFNDGIYSKRVFKSGEKLVLPDIEIGGTSFDEVFEYAKSEKCLGLIMLTDGQSSIPEKPARMTVAWLLTGCVNEDIPYGKKIKI